MLHLWRAPHRKDDMWAYDDWVKYGLKEISWKTDLVKVTRLSAGQVEIKVNLTGTGKHDFIVRHQVTYTINGIGIIKADNNVSFNADPKLVLARLGVRFFLKQNLDRFEYFGRGPMENYADRKSGFDVGHYLSTIAQQQTPYEKPMDCGNHEDVRWANVSTAKGTGIAVKQTDELFQVTALPYSDEEMTDVEYKIDLPKSKGTVLCVSNKTLGVGSYGCGPRPLEQYRVYAKDTSFSYQIQLFSKK
jgi:beta-galactosidase